MTASDAQTLLDRVREALADATPLPPSEIRAESELVGELGLSSLELVMLFGRLEAAFGVRFGEDDLTGIRTVEDVVMLIRRLQR